MASSFSSGARTCVLTFRNEREYGSRSSLASRSPGLCPLVSSRMPLRRLAGTGCILSSASTFVPTFTVSASTIFTSRTLL